MESSNLPTSPSMGRPVHGSIKPAELRQLGLDPAQVIDFSASISPIGPPKGLWEALSKVDLTVYPDPECLELREAIATHLDVGAEQVLVGNGTTEIIHLLARACLSPNQGVAGNTAFLLTPTYSEYIGACRLAGANIFSISAHYSGGFYWDIEDAQAHIAAQQPALVFVCNPNNPTGVFLPEADVKALAQATARGGGLLVLDEAYISFVDNPWDSVSTVGQENVVLLRSMTKDYALTGLRLGYAIAATEVISSLAAYQPDWSVNSLAQAAGLVALADTGYLPEARRAVNLSKEFLTEELTSLGFTVLPSSANFLLVQVGNGTIMREKLLRRGVVVRDCTSFGLADCIRIGSRALPDCERLVEAMEQAV